MIATVLAAALTFAPSDAKLAMDTARELVVSHTPRDSGTFRSAQAANFLLDSVSATGMDAMLDRWTAQTPRGAKLFTNVESIWCTNPDAPWVVALSHYDTKSGVNCPGANDGASTSGLLVALAGCVFSQKPEGINILFVWTDGEECINEYGFNDGLHGSRHLVERLKENGMKVRAAICLDMLGDKDLMISIPKNTTPALRRGILKQAAKMGLADKVQAIDECVIDDHVPFLQNKINAVNLIDFHYGKGGRDNSYWHTSADTIDKISEESLLTSGKLVAAILSGLVERPKPPPEKQQTEKEQK